jgi:uncharacterized protein YecT (DUF1311 family)
MLLIAMLLAGAPVQTQADMNRSTSATYAQADAAMTAQWKRTLAYMKGRDAQDTSRGGGFGYAAALLESQRAWLKFRDTQCVIAGGEFAGGSAQGMAMATCKTRLSRDRTAQLKALVWPR